MNLKDLLHQAKFEIMPDQEAAKKQILASVQETAKTEKPRHLKNIYMYAAAAAALILLIGLGVFSFRYFSFDRSYNITGDIAALSEIVYAAPRDVTENGVSTDTTLDIVTRDKISVSRLKECLSVSPEVEYEVCKKGVNRFSLRFADALEPDTSYTISSVASGSVVYRWSMQTEKDFGICNVYPVTYDEYVEVSTAIEVTFSESSVNDLQAYFSIEPAVSGSFHHNSRTWVFQPDEPLQAYTTYTVTINGELSGLHDKLGEDYVFQFSTGYSEDRYAYLETAGFDIADTFITSETPLAKVCAQNMPDAPADVTVYKIPDADSYIALHDKYDDTAVVSGAIANDIGQNNYSVHSKFSASPNRSASEGTYYFQYPKNLEAGYYIAEIVWGNAKLYQFLQSTDLAVYAVEAQGEFSVWVNSTQNKQPVARAEIDLDGEGAARTDEDGIAVLRGSSEGKTHHLLRVTVNSLPPYIIFMPTTKSQPASEYYTYLYTNSSVYRPTDTVQIWGFIGKRNTAAAQPNAVIYADWNDTEYPVTLKSDGTFSLEVPLQNYLLSDSGMISLRIDETDVKTCCLQIAEYDLPIYKLEGRTDQNAYFTGDTATADLHVQYYDGTPAANLAVTESENGSFVTDADGNAACSAVVYLDPNFSLDSTNRPFHKMFDWSTDDSLEETFYTGTDYLVFNNREYINASLRKNENGLYALDIETKAVTLDRLNAMTKLDIKALAYDIPEEYYAGDSVSVPIQVELHQVTYIRERTGSTYDPVRKQISATYEYKPKDEIVKTFDISTSNGSAILNDISIPKGDGYCYFRLVMADSAGAESFTYVSAQDQALTGGDSYTLDVGTELAEVGEIVDLSIKTKETLQEITEGSMIYHIIGDKILDTVHVSDVSAQFIFEERYVPDIAVCGAYFDGVNIHPLSARHIRLNTTERKLNVQITPDRQIYAPNDEVTLKISVTDTDGAPVSAAYNVNVVDRALYDTYGNPSGILEELYQNIADIYSINTFVSHRDYYAVPYAEGGGGGGGEYRTDFEDTPAFICGHTDAAGVDEITFTLPDSITEWMLIAQAVTEDVKAGGCTAAVTATKDLFISANRADSFKNSDDLVVSFRIDGTKIAETDLITSTVTLMLGDQPIDSRTVEHAANKLQYINFGKHKNGAYTVQVVSQSKELVDALEYTCRVTDSTLNVITVSDDLSGNDRVSELILMDENREQLVDVLRRLAVNSSARLDQFIGSTIAQNYMQNTLDSVNWSALSNYIADGGYASTPFHSDYDLLVTARVASLLGDHADRTQLLYCFDRVLSDPSATNEDIICALWGKAALHQAVESDLNYYYVEGNGLTVRQHLLFALAYAYSGNQTKANEIYNNRIRPILTEDGNALYIEDEDEEAQQTANALLAMLVARISAQDAPSILLYNDAHDSDIQLSSFADAAYILEYVPLMEGQNTVQITFADGDTKEISYDKFAVCTVNLDGVAADTIQIVSLEGKTSAKIRKAVPASELLAGDGKIGDISLTVPETITVGDTIYVTVEYADYAGDKVAQLALPAGLHFLGAEAGSGQILEDGSIPNAYVFTKSDKSVVLMYGKAPDPAQVTAAFRLQAVMPGNYTIEPIIQMVNGEQYRSSAPLQIQIAPSETEEIAES